MALKSALTDVNRTSAALAKASKRRDEALNLSLQHGAIQDDLSNAVENDLCTSDPGLSMALTFYRNSIVQLVPIAERHDLAVEHALALGATAQDIAANVTSYEQPSLVIPVQWLGGRRVLKLRPEAPWWQVAAVVVALLIVAVVAVVVTAVAIGIVVIASALALNQKLGPRGKTFTKALADDITTPAWKRKSRRRR